MAPVLESFDNPSYIYDKHFQISVICTYRLIKAIILPGQLIIFRLGKIRLSSEKATSQSIRYTIINTDNPD